MKSFLFIVTLLFSLTLFGQRSGGRVGGNGFGEPSSGSLSSSGGSVSSNEGSGFSNFSENSNNYTGGNAITEGDGNWRDFFYLVILFFIPVGTVFIIFLNKDKILFKISQIKIVKTEYVTLKFQFLLHATAYELRKKFINIAETLDFTDKESLKQLIIYFANIIEENNHYIKSAELKNQTVFDSAESEVLHEEYIQNETGKLSEETYIKIENHKSIVKQLKEENNPKFMEIKEYIIFTLIVSYKKFKIDFKDDYSYQYYSSILERLKNIDVSNIMAVDVIWTPDAENDVLTEDDVLSNYNNLKLV